MQKNKKRRQLLLVLPLLILPFVTLAFWALGGGQGRVESKSAGTTGINSTIPSANLSFRPEDKMSVYARADRQEDAGKAKLGQFKYPTQKDSANEMDQLAYVFDTDADEGSKKVEQKISELQGILENSRNSQQAANYAKGSIDPATYGLQPGEQVQTQIQIKGQAQEDQLSRLNQLNELIARSTDADNDEDTRQINDMLDKILAIQHPEQNSDKLRVLSKENKDRIYSVGQRVEDVGVQLLSPDDAWKERSSGRRGEGLKIDSVNGLTVHHDVSGWKGTQSERYQASDDMAIRGAFYDIDPEKVEDNVVHYTIPAVVAETQALVSGGTVKMRLTMDVFINGTLIPKGNFVYGTCSVNGERLKIEIKSIRIRNQLFPVRLAVYDLDGMEGVRIPGAISRDATKEGADRALHSVQMMSLDPNVATQAAAAGIEATKGLLSKKVKLVRVTVKAGYPVLLLDNKGQQLESK